MDFNESITYPRQREDWVKTVLIGGVLTFLAFLLIPVFIVYGYVVMAIRNSLSGDTAPPAFDDWGTLLVDGIKAWIIGLVYLLIPLIVAWVTIGGSIAAVGTGTRAGASAGLGGMVVGLLLSGILSLVFGYLAVVAIVNFAREERMGAAFDVEVIKRIGLDGDFLIPWLVSVGLFIVVGFVGMIPFVGWLLVPFAGFYVSVVAADLWATGFAQALEPTADVGRTTGGEPAL